MYDVPPHNPPRDGRQDGINATWLLHSITLVRLPGKGKAWQFGRRRRIGPILTREAQRCDTPTHLTFWPYAEHHHRLFPMR